MDEFFPFMHDWIIRGEIQPLRNYISKGADVNAVDENNKTALHVAIEHNDYTISNFLLRKGADRNLLSDGYTPLHFAMKKAIFSRTRVR